MTSPFLLSRTEIYAGRTAAGQVRRIEVVKGPRQQRYMLEPNQAVFYEGDAGDSAFFVRVGRMAIVRRSDKAGDYVPIATVEPGGIFGEIALIDGRPRTAAAVAMVKTEVLEITRAQFDAKVGEMPPEAERRVQALLAFIREVLPRAMWRDGRMPEIAGRSLAQILPLLSGDSGAEIDLGGEFLRALYDRLIGYARDRLPSDAVSR